MANSILLYDIHTGVLYSIDLQRIQTELLLLLLSNDSLDYVCALSHSLVFFFYRICEYSRAIYESIQYSTVIVKCKQWSSLHILYSRSLAIAQASSSRHMFYLKLREFLKDQFANSNRVRQVKSSQVKSIGAELVNATRTLICCCSHSIAY